MNKNELLTELKRSFGETPTDEQIELLEKINDSLFDGSEFEQKLTEAETKYNDLRARYVSRFGEGSTSKTDDTHTNETKETEREEIATVDDIVKDLM